MKKLVAILLCMLICVSAAACGVKEQTVNTDTEGNGAYTETDAGDTDGSEQESEKQEDTQKSGATTYKLKENADSLKLH